VKSLDPYWPSHASEPTSDKTYDVAAELCIHPMQAYGHIRAFRTRYPQEAPAGRLRGGAAQVERLALWDGAPGKLAAAFVNAKVVDVVDGVHVAHDHEHYAGAVLAERGKGRERTRRWREKNEKPSPEREGDGVTVTSPVTSRSLSLTHSLTSPDLNSSSGSEGMQGEGHAPRKEPRDAGGLMNGGGGRWVRAGRQGGWQAGKPYTVAELVGLPEGEKLKTRFPALDGKHGRPTFEEALGTLWTNFEGWVYPSPALEKLATYVGKIHETHRRAFEADVGTGAVAGEISDPRRAALQKHWRARAGPDDLPPFHIWAERVEADGTADDIVKRAGRGSGGGQAA
jgi:hypothetical protein